MSVQLTEIEPEYVYVTIPAEYICVYHRILAMLADYGEEMLRDCKASCTDKNSGVIDCFNMFNAAVAARKLGKEKLAETIIKYVKAKINQIYHNKDNSTSFVFPIDENGQLKAFVSCGERPKFEINPNDGELYEHKFNNGFDEHFRLGEEDYAEDEETSPVEDIAGNTLTVEITPRYEKIDDEYHPCADIIVKYNDKSIDVNNTDYDYYFDGIPVSRFNDVSDLTVGHHTFTIVILYKGLTAVDNKVLYYEK